MADPTEFIHIFLKHSPELIDFLEHIHTNHISSSNIIANTLLELYINSFSDPFKSTNKLDEARHFLQDVDTNSYHGRNSANKSVSLKEKKALEFLMANSEAYDMNLALVICQLHNFRVIY